MRKHPLLTLAAAIALAACSSTPSPSSSPVTGGDREVTAVAEQLRIAMIDPTRPALDTLVAEQLSYGHSGGKVDTKQSFVADLVEGRSDFVTIDLSDQTVALSGDVALIRHTLNAKTLDAGKPGTVSLKVLQVWQRQGGGWKLLARQAVRAPS